MCASDNGEIINKINEIVGNSLLAHSIYESVSIALQPSSQVMLIKDTVQKVVEWSVKQASYDLDKHKRAPLFVRTILHGPLSPDKLPEHSVKENVLNLSDTECGSLVQYLYYYMVNRFKGELGELLALKPVVELVQNLQRTKRLPKKLQLYWGDMVHVRSKRRKGSIKLGHYVKGADGLLVQEKNGSIIVHGVVEVKSKRAGKAAMVQLNKHCAKLEKGVKLGTVEYPSESITLSESGLIRTIVMSSIWKTNRELLVNTDTDGKSVIVYHDPNETPKETEVIESEPDIWKITLGWSREAMEQAAYNMTFRYMAQVGKRVYTENPKPKGWEDMTSEEAGMNAIKMVLYYLLLRPLTDKQVQLGTLFYNIYSFGYPVGLDHGRKYEMIWLEKGKFNPLKLGQKKKKKRKISE